MEKQNQRKVNNRSGIVICGSYGLGNAGDESILKAILQEVRAVAPAEEITVLSRDPEETKMRHGVWSLHMFDLPAIHRLMGRAKLYINGGGSLIQDVTSRRSLWYYLFTLRMAKRRGCKVLMYGCGIGPVKHPKDVALTRRTLNGCVDAITLREDSSLKELQRFGVTKPEIVLASDPALTLQRADEADIDRMMEQSGLAPHGAYLGICLRDWPGFAEKAPVFAAAVRYARSEHGLTPVFFSINHRSDGAAADQVVRYLENKPCILRQPLSTELTLGLMSRMRAVISMRLHGLIFAAGQGVPLVGVVYDPKVSAFLSYMGQELYEDLSQLSTESLCAKLDQALSLGADPAALKDSVDRLRHIEQHNPDTMRKLLQAP